MAEPPAPGPPPRGFRDAFNDLKARKYQELGGVWDSRTNRARLAEAARRARVEMTRRVATRSGRRRLAESTIARWAARNELPTGVDQAWLDRWAAIDRAGGIRAFAQTLGVSERRVVAWRDSLDPKVRPPAPIPPGVFRPPPPEPQRVGVETIGTLTIKGKDYPGKRIPTAAGDDYAILIVEPEAVQAWAEGDYDTLGDLLSEAITDQIIVPEFNLPPSYDPHYTVTDIVNFWPNIND